MRLVAVGMGLAVLGAGCGGIALEPEGTQLPHPSTSWGRSHREAAIEGFISACLWRERGLDSRRSLDELRSGVCWLSFNNRRSSVQ